MSGKGNCDDNAMVETFFKTIKSELVWRTVFHTRGQAEQAIARYIDGFYNPVRRHSALDFLSPVSFEKLAANRANASPLSQDKSRGAAVAARGMRWRPFMWLSMVNSASRSAAPVA